MTAYHVTLGGQGLILDLQSYKRRLAPTFAPKSSSGERAYGDLSFPEQVWAISDWSGGEGALDADPDQPGRWRSGPGLDGHSVPGSLRLGPSVATSGTLSAAAQVLAPFNGFVYAGLADGNVYQGPAWALSSGAIAPRPIRCLAVYNGELWAGNASDGQLASFNGTSWTFPRVTAAGVGGARSMAVFEPALPRLFVGFAKPNAGELRAWNGSTLSGPLFLLQETYPEALAVLDRKLYVFGGDFAAWRGAIYSYDGSTWQYVLAIPDGAPMSAVAWNGAVWFTTYPSLDFWKFDGSALTKVAAGLGVYQDGPRGLAVWGNALWLLGRERGTNALQLKRYDGASWSTPGYLAGAHAASPQGLAALGADLYLGSASAAVYQAAGAAWRTSGTLESGLFAAGLPSVDKVFRAATVLHAALGSGESVQLQYRLEDAGAWAVLGTSATVGATAASFTFPGGVVGKLLGLRLVLSGPGTSTPALYDVLVRYALAPEAKREWEFAALAEGSAELPLLTLDGAPEPLSGPQISAALWALQGQSGPLAFVDLDGVSRSVWFVDLQEELADRSQRRGYALRAKLKLREA